MSIHIGSPAALALAALEDRPCATLSPLREAAIVQDLGAVVVRERALKRLVQPDVPARHDDEPIDEPRFATV